MADLNDGGISGFIAEDYHDMSIETPLLFDCLGPEILLTIFDQICTTEPNKLLDFRLTCRLFDQIIAPLCYRRVQLTAMKLAAVSGQNKREKILQNVHAHTRHVKFRQLLDWDDVASLLFDCAQLDAITFADVLQPYPTFSWACGREILQCYFPDAMRRLVRDKWPKVQIFNEFLDYPGMRQSGSFLKTFPASNMISLTLHNRVVGQANRPLHQFLTSCMNLRELRLYDLKFLDSTFEPADGRLPAIRTFFTNVRSWPYSPDDVDRVWDFTQLQELDILWHVFGSMSQSMSPEDFCSLRRLRIQHEWVGTDGPIGVYTQYHTMRTSFLNSILEQMPEHQLQQLEVKCHLLAFSMTALARHGRSLRILRLLDASGYEVDGSTTPTTTFGDLNKLSATCPKLTEMAIGINFMCSGVRVHVVSGFQFFADQWQDIPGFAGSLAGFRDLRIITLYMQKLPRSYSAVGINKVLDFGQKFAKSLYERKLGHSLSKVSLNVGEWTARNRPHRLIQSPKADFDMGEAYQPRWLLNYSWDAQGVMLVEHAN